MISKPRVVIIDDSLLVRNILGDVLSKKKGMEIVATGKTGLDCLDLAERLKPDAIILDVEMPIMDGLTALAELKKRKSTSAVIMLSVLTQHGADATFKALELGAIDFVPKPNSGNQFSADSIGDSLAEKITLFLESRQVSEPRVAIPPRKVEPIDKKGVIQAVAIGTSTGGPKALQTVFTAIPEDFSKPIFVVQHMPPGFTKAFSDRLNAVSKIKVKEAEHGDIVESGHAYIAAGDHHMRVVQKGALRTIELDRSPSVNGHRPSIEVMFESLLQSYVASHLLAMIMTGMGRDGSQSITNIRQRGGVTLAQDEASSVVYGMNRVAVELGGIDHVLPLEELVPKTIEIVKMRG